MQVVYVPRTAATLNNVKDSKLHKMNGLKLLLQSSQAVVHVCKCLHSFKEILINSFEYFTYVGMNDLKC